MTCLRVLLTALTAFGLTACVSQHGPSSGAEGATSAFVQAQSDRARTLQADGRTAEAIRVWRLILTVEPASLEASASLERLLAERDGRIAALLTTVQQTDSPRRRSTLLLKVLALDGDNKAAHEGLRALNKQRMLAYQTRISDERLAKLAERESSQVSEAVTQSALLVEPIPADEDPAVEAERLYQEGLQIWRTDLDGAIDRWESVLVLDPSHGRVAARLTQAKRMRENLRRIQSTRAED